MAWGHARGGPHDGVTFPRRGMSVTAQDAGDHPNAKSC